MYLHQLLLSNDDIDNLTKIYKEIATDVDFLRFVRERLYEFIRSEAPDFKITPVLMTRLLRHTSSSSLYLQHILFDFSEKYVFPLLVGDGARPAPADTQKRILDLQSSRQKRLCVSQIPNEVVSLNNMWRFIQRVPDQYINEFVGYRRSTTEGSIIKYYLEITKAGKPSEVVFENLYIYDGVTTFVKGFGVFLNGTLYLIGHATQINNKSDDKNKEEYIEAHPSAGMRVLALHCIAGTDHLAGLVLTASRETPIAARVLMIPAKHHRSWSAPNKEHEDNNGSKKSEMIIRRLGDMDANETIMVDLKKTAIINEEEQLDIMIDNITVSLLSCRKFENDDFELERNITRLRGMVEKEYGKYVSEHNCRERCRQENTDCHFPEAPDALRKLLTSIIGDYVKNSSGSLRIEDYLSCQGDGVASTCRMSSFL